MLILLPMSDEGWQRRFLDAIQAEIDKGRSRREISKAAGLGENFLNQLLKTGREPSVGNFIALTRDGLGVSPVKILTGIEMTPAAEELLRLYSDLSEDGRERLLMLFRELQGT